MSWSSALRPMVLAGALLGVGAILGACSFSPVYSGALASQPELNIAYAKPTSRLEQVIYQELALRFGTSTSETAPLATVSAGVSAVGVVMSATNNPNPPTDLTVTATLTITRRDGSEAEPITITRSATAVFISNGQVLAARAAEDEASERAAKAAAESLRLALLAALSR